MFRNDEIEDLNPDVGILPGDVADGKVNEPDEHETRDFGDPADGFIQDIPE